MKDEELIEKMREAVTIETAHPNDDDPTEWQLVNDACLLSLANMAKQHFVEQACDALEETVKKIPGFSAVITIEQAQQAIREKFKI